MLMDMDGMNRLITYEFHNCLQPLTDEQWAQLFPGHPDSPSMIRLMESSGLEGFQFHSIVARIGEEPVLLLPLFESHYSIASTLEGKAQAIGRTLEKLLPGLLRPRVLGVGFVEGEWGQIGINPMMPQKLVRAALTGALEFLQSVAENLDVPIVAFKDFCTNNEEMLAEIAKSGYALAESLPFCQLKVAFTSVDDYLNSLPRKVRQDLRRKMRQSAQVRVEYTTVIDPWLDQIYELYTDQVERSDLSFGMHRKRYFAEVCERVPGAQYILFFLGEKLIGFNLMIHQGAMLIDKYVGIEPVEGRHHNIYFTAWLEKIRYSAEHGIKLMHLGAAAEQVKVRMGAYTISSYVLFHHRNPIINLALAKLTPLLSYKPAATASADEAAHDDEQAKTPQAAFTRLEEARSF